MSSLNMYLLEISSWLQMCRFMGRGRYIWPLIVTQTPWKLGWGCGRVSGNRQYSAGSSIAAGTIQIKVRKCCESINDAIDFFLPNSWLEFFNKTMEFFLRDHVIICPLLCRAPQFLKSIFSTCKLYSVKPYNKISINKHGVCTEKIISLKTCLFDVSVISDCLWKCGGFGKQRSCK